MRFKYQIIAMLFVSAVSSLLYAQDYVAQCPASLPAGDELNLPIGWHLTKIPTTKVNFNDVIIKFAHADIPTNTVEIECNYQNDYKLYSVQTIAGTDLSLLNLNRDYWTLYDNGTRWSCGMAFSYSASECSFGGVFVDGAVK